MTPTNPSQQHHAGQAGHAVPRSLALQLDAARADVRQPLRHQAAQWAAAWFADRPDTLILLGCNGSALNADPAHRQLRLRRIKAAMVRQGVPAQRIRYTTEMVVTPDGAQTPGQAMAWCRAVMPEDLEATDVRPIEEMLSH